MHRDGASFFDRRAFQPERNMSRAAHRAAGNILAMAAVLLARADEGVNESDGQ
jgi:hypothetical protein